MMNKEYDERQLFVRYKYGFQALIVLMILMVINAFIVDMVYVWADITASTFLLILAVAWWYGVRTIMAGAYFYTNPKSAKYSMIFMSVMSLFYACMFIIRLMQGSLQVIEDGKATLDLIFVVSVPMFIFLAIASAVNWHRRNRTGE